jgi:PHD/YefM family antitoxin component YafN of YafNO toxin-antitoxin module
MSEYSFTEARQHFASILDEAKREGIVCVKKGSNPAKYVAPRPGLFDS